MFEFVKIKAQTKRKAIFPINNIQSLILICMLTSSYVSPSQKIPTYTVSINTSTFALKQPCLKDKTQKQYLPQYWQKCRMDQKHIKPSCEDRLSELTTGQIDRIIDMQKIRTLLNDKKMRSKQVYIEYDTSKPNRHPNVYEANFLAKINAIAIKRNIRHQKSEGFDDYFGDETSHQQGDRQKKTSQLPYKYIKKYKLDNKHKRSKTFQTQDDQQKSISSIKDQIQEFQQKLQNKRAPGLKLIKIKNQNQQKFNLRWFNGMSGHYLKKDKLIQYEKTNIQRNLRFDIESQVKRNTFSFQKNQYQLGNKIKQQSSTCEPFLRYRINRVRHISTNK